MNIKSEIVIKILRQKKTVLDVCSYIIILWIPLYSIFFNEYYHHKILNFDFSAWHLSLGFFSIASLE